MRKKLSGGTVEKFGKANAFQNPITISRPGQPDDVLNTASDFLLSYKKVPTTTKPLYYKESSGFEPFFPNYKQENSLVLPAGLQRQEFGQESRESDVSLKVKSSWDKFLDTRTVVAGVDRVITN